MKKLFAALSVCSLFFFGSCSDDPEISVSQTNFKDLPHEASSFEVSINTQGIWTATSLVKWITPSEPKGETGGTLTINVDSNVSEQARNGQVVIRGMDGTLVHINVSQSAYPIDQEFTYELPVIFHVLYKSRSDRKQFIDYSRIVKVLDNVNKLYDGNVRYPEIGEPGLNLNLQFVLATADEEGKPLSTPGVEYIKVDQMPIDCQEFLASPDNVKYLWDPNKYINVFLYNFQAIGGNGTILGISHIPYTIVGSESLPGLQPTTTPYITKENLDYTHCVSINSLYMYEDPYTGEMSNSGDINVTVAHELGHYLGLHHAFNEDVKGCQDSDFCLDTPPYDRDAYIMELYYMMEQAALRGTYVPLSKGAVRINCSTAEEFLSFNIMDYEMSYADRFTPDQRKRIRHVLNYSPMIPGPKKGIASTRSIIKGKIDLPARAIQ